MGWSFRRSFRLGPLKLNLSKSGIGYSVGAGGIREGRDAEGRRYRSLSLRGTGISKRDYLDANRHKPRRSSFARALVVLLGAAVLIALWIIKSNHLTVADVLRHSSTWISRIRNSLSRF
jgi:hypothetical protein